MAIEALSAEERQKVICNDIDSDEWYYTNPMGATHDRDTNWLEEIRRKWSNPEIIFHDVGLRLEFLEQGKVDLVMGLLKASLSEKGFEKVLGAMKFNHFLGEIVHAEAILNQYSYQWVVNHCRHLITTLLTRDKLAAFVFLEILRNKSPGCSHFLGITSV